MDVLAYMNLLRRRWLPILLCSIAGVTGAFWITSETPKTYRASARVFVNIPAARGVQEAFQAVQISTQLMESYAKVATSRSAAAAVVDRLHLKVRPEVIAGKLSASAQTDTVILTIHATDRDPALARVLANTTAAVFGDIINQLEEGQSAQIQTRVIDPAGLPTVPISPRGKLNVALGATLGILAGFSVGFVLEALDRTIATADQLAELFEAPLLGVVPSRREVNLNPVLLPNAHPATAEAFRSIRTAIRFMNRTEPAKTLVVTSPQAGEGKSVVASNLAVAMANAGERVILVDADLRRSKLGERFGLDPAAHGLTSILLEGIPPQNAVSHVGDLLWMISTGPVADNPAELLGSQAMAELVKNLALAADVVIFDLPPVLPVTDAVVLSTQVDAVVLVGRLGRTSHHAAIEARRRLRVVDAKVIGAVANAAPRQSSYDTYEYELDRDRPRVTSDARLGTIPALRSSVGRADASREDGVGPTGGEISLRRP